MYEDTRAFCAAEAPVCASYHETVQERYELQARNEALLRTVNEQIRALDESVGWADPEQRFVAMLQLRVLGPGVDLEG